MDLGKNMKFAREKAGLTQVALSEIMGVQQRDISRWENNARTINVFSLKKFCEAVGASADAVLEISK